jgi:L-amino acid N-acyltransferase YncA
MSHSIRRFEASDQAAMLAFTASLPEHDLLFLSRDVQHPRVVEAWAQAVGEGTIDSLVAEDDGKIVGTAALVRDPLGWSPHVGEVRLLVSPDRRGAGLGRDLLEAIFAIAHAHGATKLVAQMTPDQTGSVTLFESLGFRGEAMLRDHVCDRSGQFHDLVILSLRLGALAASHEAFGWTE